MQLDSYKKFFMAIGLFGILLFASPSIALLINVPTGQPFSEMYLLGPNHTINSLPFDILEGDSHLVYIGVGNELGHSSYYSVYVKLGAENESFPNIDLGLSSTLPTLYNYNVFLENHATWQAPLTFQLDVLTFENGVSVLSEVSFNKVNYSLNEASAWNSNRTGYYYNLIFELWVYNTTLGISQYSGRFLALRLNMTGQ